MEQTLQEIYDYYKTQSTMGQSELVIALLTEIQSQVGYLSEEAQNLAADAAGVKKSYITAVIKNMPHLHSQPFKHEILICISDRCKKQGGDQVLKKFQQLLKVKPGQITRDGTFLLKVQYCMRNCAHGPNVKIDGKFIENVKPSEVQALIRKYKAKSSR